MKDHDQINEDVSKPRPLNAQRTLEEYTQAGRARDKTQWPEEVRLQDTAQVEETSPGFLAVAPVAGALRGPAPAPARESVPVTAAFSGRALVQH